MSSQIYWRLFSKHVGGRDLPKIDPEDPRFVQGNNFLIFVKNLFLPLVVSALLV